MPQMATGRSELDSPFISGRRRRWDRVAAVGGGVTAAQRRRPGRRTLGCTRRAVIAGIALAAWETLCDSQQNTGYSVNGGFAEYALADPNYACHLPDGLDFELSSSSDPLRSATIVDKGLKETDAEPGDTAAISGIGELRPRRRPVCEGHGPRGNRRRYSDEKLSLGTQTGR